MVPTRLGRIRGLWLRACHLLSKPSVIRLLRTPLTRGWFAAQARTRPSTGQHQLKASTRLDRYPELMSFVRDRIGHGNPAPRILSFGCSTGEECLTLHQYFPAARIVGVDINTALLNHARRSCQHLLDRKVSLYHSSKLDDEPDGAFDVIFCMSVLLRHPDTKTLQDCGHIYPFTDYDDEVIRLDRVLRVGGFLVIQNSTFRFADSSVSGRYRVVPGDPGRDGLVTSIAIFGRDNLRIHGITPQVVFQKHA